MHKLFWCCSILLLNSLPQFAQPIVSGKLARPTLTALEAEERLIQKVTPDYPKTARQGRMEGPVTVHIIVNREGRVVKMTPQSGNPFLLVAAMDAILRWRYRPYTVSGERVEFETDVNLKFVL